jgi:hypothetical protein
MFLAGGNMKRGISEGSRTWGFLTVSLSDAGPALARPARRETEGEGRAEGRTEQSRRGTKSIFRLRYKIDNYTYYIGNRVPSPWNMKAKYYPRGQGETGTTCATMNAYKGTILRETRSDGSTYKEKRKGRQRKVRRRETRKQGK